MLEFADALVERAAAKARTEIERQSDVEYIPKKEAINLLGVCDATLWHWARSGYLVPVKLGRRVFYLLPSYRHPAAPEPLMLLSAKR